MLKVMDLQKVHSAAEDGYAKSSVYCVAVTASIADN